MPLGAIWIRPLVRAHAICGHSGIVFKLLTGLKRSLLPSDRDMIWKLAFRGYHQGNHLDEAIQLVLTLKNKTLDPELSAWSGAYTLCIERLIDNGESLRALQLYAIMISDGFDLRNHLLAQHLLDYLKTGTFPGTLDSAEIKSYLKLQNHLELLIPTLEVGAQPQAPYNVHNRKKRNSKRRRKIEKEFLAQLDRDMGHYKPRQTL